MMSLVWDEATDIKRSELLVLLSLADWANDEGVCWPSIERLGQRARINRRNTYSALARLEESGWVSRTSREGRSTIYTVHKPVLESTLSSAESVAGDIRDDPSVSLATDVAGDTPVAGGTGGGVIQDTPGVSQATGGGVVQDTQNPKEPSVEPSSPPPSVPSALPTLAWYPSKEQVEQAMAAYPWLTRVKARQITLDLITWSKDKHKDPTDALWLTFVRKENERLAEIERAEAKEAEAEKPKRPWYHVAD